MEKKFTFDEIQIGIDYMINKDLILECLNYKFKEDEYVLIGIDMNVKFDLELFINHNEFNLYMIQLIDYIKNLPLIETEIKQSNHNSLLTKAYIKDNNVIKFNYYYDNTKYDSLDRIHESCCKILITLFELL
jgi:hypothetical protein